MTENAAEIEPGEGVLWRSKTEPTSFKFYAADPVAGQVAIGARLKVRGADTLVAVRLKIDRGKIQEIEQLQAGNVNAAALALLTTPVSFLTSDVPPAERLSRDL